MYQQHYSENYVNSAQESEVDCSSQNTSDADCNPHVQGMQDLEIVFIYDTHSLTTFQQRKYQMWRSHCINTEMAQNHDLDKQQYSADCTRDFKSLTSFLTEEKKLNIIIRLFEVGVRYTMDICEQNISYHPVTRKIRGSVKVLHMLEGETTRKISLKRQIFTLQNGLPFAQLDQILSTCTFSVLRTF